MTAGRPHAHGPAAIDDVAEVETVAAAVAMVWTRAEMAVLDQVSPTQLRTLMAVARGGGGNLSQLAEELGAIPSSVSRLCDRLIAAGLLERTTSLESRREVSLTLRPEGRAVLRRMQQHRHDALTDVLSRMTPTGRQALRRGLTEFARVAGADLEDRAARAAARAQATA